MGAVTISTFFVICVYILINMLLESDLWLEVCYIYFCEWKIMPPHHHYICIFIDIFLHNIPVSSMICWFMVYNLLIGCTPHL